MMQRYMRELKEEQYLFHYNGDKWDFKPTVSLEDRGRALESIQEGERIPNHEILRIVGESNWNQNPEFSRFRDQLNASKDRAHSSRNRWREPTEDNIITEMLNGLTTKSDPPAKKPSAQPNQGSSKEEEKITLPNRDISAKTDTDPPPDAWYETARARGIIGDGKGGYGGQYDSTRRQEGEDGGRKGKGKSKQIDEDKQAGILRSIKARNQRIDEDTELTQEEKEMNKQLNVVCLRDMLSKYQIKDSEGKLILKCLRNGCPRDHDPNWEPTEKHVELGTKILLERWAANKEWQERQKAKGKGEGKGEGKGNCHNCDKPGHYAKDCPEEKRNRGKGA